MHPIAAIWAFALSISLVAAFQVGSDLMALYGPGGVKAITALAEGQFQRDWHTWFNACLLPIHNYDVVFTIKATGALGAGLACAGSTLMALSLFGRKYAVQIATALSVSMPPIWLGLLTGSDSTAMGFGLFGTGLAMYASRYDKLLIFLLPIGCLVSWFAIQLKSTALPLLAFYGILPFLAKNHRTRMLLISIGVLAAALLIENGMLIRYVWPSENDTIHLSAQFITGFILSTPPWHAILLVTIIGLLFMTKRVNNCAMLLICLGALSVSMTALGEKARVRYILPLLMPLLALGFGTYFRWLGRLLKFIGTNKNAYLKRVGVILSFIPIAYMGLDTINFLHNWSHVFKSKESHYLFKWPALPNALKWDHVWISDLDHSDHSVIGAKSLLQLVEEAKPSGVGTIPLRDGREFHVRAYSALLDQPYRIVSTDNCCQKNEPIKRCATRVVNAFEDRGGRLILPLRTLGDQRIPLQHKEWAMALESAAKQKVGWKNNSFWHYYDGQQGGKGPLPCVDKRAIKRRQKYEGI